MKLCQLATWWEFHSVRIFMTFRGWEGLTGLTGLPEVTLNDFALFVRSLSLYPFLPLFLPVSLYLVLYFGIHKKSMHAKCFRDTLKLVQPMSWLVSFECPECPANEVRLVRSILFVYSLNGASRKNYVDESSVNGIYFIVTYVNCGPPHISSIMTKPPSSLSTLRGYASGILMNEWTLMHGLRMSFLICIINDDASLRMSHLLCYSPHSSDEWWFISTHSKSYSLCNRCTFSILLVLSSQFYSSTNYPAINYISLPDKCCARTQLLIE